MKTLCSAVVALFAAVANAAPATLAPDPGTTRIVRYCGHRDLDLYVADPDTNERDTLPISPSIRNRRGFIFNFTSNFVRIKFNKTVGQVDDFESVDVPADQQEPDAYVFNELVPAAPPSPAKLKVTRYERVSEIPLPASGPDAEAMLQRARAFKADQLITVRTKGAKDKLVATDVDTHRKPALAEFVKNGDATVDGKKFPGVIVRVAGEEKTYALPPAGQKPASTDAEAIASARRMRKGVYYKLTFDSARPDVIRTAALAVSVVPRERDGYRASTPGLNVHVYGESLHPQLSPAPITEADNDLRNGMQNGFTNEVIRNLKNDERDRIWTILNRFARQDEVDNDERKLRQYLQKVDKSKLEAEIAAATVELSLKYRTESQNGYDDVRRILGDRAAKVEAWGRDPKRFRRPNDGGGGGPGGDRD